MGEKLRRFLTTQILLTGAITGPQSLGRNRIHFTVRFRTTTSSALVIGPKRRGLFHGLKRRTKGRLSPHAKIDGSPSAKAIGQLMHSGKIQDRSERIIGNTCLAMSAQNSI